jgi:cytoskeletal protein RodZ
MKAQVKVLNSAQKVVAETTLTVSMVVDVMPKLLKWLDHQANDVNDWHTINIRIKRYGD